MNRDDQHDLEQDRDLPSHHGDMHATTGGAAAAGAVTGGVIGLTGGRVGAAIGAVGGALVAVAAERLMHAAVDAEADAGYIDESSMPTADVHVGRTDIVVASPPAERVASAQHAG